MKYLWSICCIFEVILCFGNKLVNEVEKCVDNYFIFCFKILWVIKVKRKIIVMVYIGNVGIDYYLYNKWCIYLFVIFEVIRFIYLFN